MTQQGLLLQDRVVLVTGAGSGIGRAAALHCASLGAKVLAADLNRCAADETASLAVKQSLQTGGTPQCQAVAVDVANENSVEAMLSVLVESFGRLDCALNAAGIEGERGRIHEGNIDNFDNVMRVNLRGVYLCMRAEVKQMLKQQQQQPQQREQQLGGETMTAAHEAECAPIDYLNYSIVNMSSSAGQGGMPEFACYSASKHAIIGLTRSAAQEYARDGIRFNALCPSTTDTPMVGRFTDRWPEWQARQNASFPVGRIGTAEELAQLVGFLFSTQCTMMTGTTLTVDGALSA